MVNNSTNTNDRRNKVGTTPRKDRNSDIGRNSPEFRVQMGQVLSISNLFLANMFLLRLKQCGGNNLDEIVSMTPPISRYRNRTSGLTS